MVLLNLLDGGPSRSGPLLGPSESMWGGILGINPRHLSSSIVDGLNILGCGAAIATVQGCCVERGARRGKHQQWCVLGFRK
jgi:hypothetical protein